MPSAQQLRALLQGTPNTRVAAQLGWSVGRVLRWRRAVAEPPYPRGARGPGPTEQAILEALHPPGTWHPKAAVAALRSYDITYALQALCRKGRLQRRGRPGHYEYALQEEE